MNLNAIDNNKITIIIIIIYSENSWHSNSPCILFLGLLTLQILKTEGLKWLMILIIVIIARFWAHLFYLPLVITDNHD